MTARGASEGATVRVAHEADLTVLAELRETLRAENAAEAAGVGDPELAELVRTQVALVAERAEAPAGFALARPDPDGSLRLACLYVLPQARGRGVARALALELVRRARESGAPSLRVETRARDSELLALCQRWGFVAERLTLATEVEALAARLDKAGGRSYGAIYVQSDDEVPIRRRLGRFVPRLPDAQLSGPRNGWIELTDERLDEDPKLLQRLARELSVATGAVSLTLGVEDGLVVRYALIERGGVVDEYLSVPLFHGPLPPGDAVALAANPTAAARLTGADPEEVRAVCRTASAPSELPPADELYRQIAEIFGVASG
ncbi:MAG: GNAT family N-acetyltransferase [Gaiellaceae bacterium]